MEISPELVPLAHRNPVFIKLIQNMFVSFKYPAKDFPLPARHGKGEQWQSWALNLTDFVELCSSQGCVGNVPGAKELHLICLKWSRLPLLSSLIMEMQPGDYRFQQAMLQKESGEPGAGGAVAPR